MRELLPLVGSHPGGRSALTCRYRCGDACFHEVPNKSGNAYLGDVVAGALSRRAMLAAGAAGTVLAATGATVVGAAPPAAARGRGTAAAAR
ncbi:phosphatase, partial [Streptomyces sp. NPDC054784]